MEFQKAFYPMCDEKQGIRIVDPESKANVNLETRLKELASIFGDLHCGRVYYYAITHTYATESHKPPYLKIDISPLKFNLLIAFLQLQFYNLVSDGYDFDEHELVGLLERKYGAKPLDEIDKACLDKGLDALYEIDNYINWEAFAAPYTKLIEEMGSTFEVEGLEEEFERLKEKYSQS